MRSDPAYRKITADEFLAMDFNTDRKFELADGVIVMMAGGSEAHAWVQGNIFSWLRVNLRGRGCRPYGSEMAVKVSETEIRYPDVSIYCGLTSRDEMIGMKAIEAPSVLIEVLSPSTTQFDQGSKLEEYQSIASVRTIAFVDPVNEMCRTVERQGDGWLHSIFSGRGGIFVPSLDLTIPHAEIFSSD